jgi:hypothetical protein
MDGAHELLAHVLEATPEPLRPPPPHHLGGGPPHVYAFGVLRIALAIAERFSARVAAADRPRADAALHLARRMEAFRSGRVRSRPTAAQMGAPVAGSGRADALGVVALAAVAARENSRGRNDRAGGVLRAQVVRATALLDGEERAAFARWLDDLLLRVACEMMIEGYWAGGLQPHPGERHAPFARCLWLHEEQGTRLWLMALREGGHGFGGWLGHVEVWHEGHGDALLAAVPPHLRAEIAASLQRKG